MPKKQFKAESKRLLDLMIHSIYTHKEIFLRELISNASDASDKRYFGAMSQGESGLTREDMPIFLKADKTLRTLTVSDCGCGMTREELEQNLGTIAHSGSLEFKRENAGSGEIDIIGQFGVGFYSAFMVAEKVTVTTRSQKDGSSWQWESSGADGYTVCEAEKETPGTDLVLLLKPDTDTEHYGEFLDEYRLRALIKKYSDYIRYPIRMEVSHSHRKEGSPDDAPEYETCRETETLNSMIPIWKKGKSETTSEEYNAFYREKFDYEDPLRVIHSSTEGAATYDALLFIPAHAPFNYYSKEYEKGLQLYASGVLIMEKCADLLPDCFSFVRGLVDSQDLSLNISREMLQHDRQLKLIAERLEKKIKSELLALRNSDREAYERFFAAFGLQLKYGIYSEYGRKKDLLADLLLYKSSSQEKPVTLSEYVSRMKEGQDKIYYACGESQTLLSRLPQAERLTEKGYEILLMTDDIDEFAVKIMQDYEGKAFCSVSEAETQTEEEKEEIKKQADDNRALFAFLKEALSDRVKEVRPSGRLKSFPVCLSTEGGISLEMEKVLNAMPTGEAIRAERVLEINTAHPVFEKLKSLFEGDPEKAKLYTEILYNQALLIEGLPVEDPVSYSNLVCTLML